MTDYELSKFIENSGGQNHSAATIANFVTLFKMQVDNPDLDEEERESYSKKLEQAEEVINNVNSGKKINLLKQIRIFK